MKVHKTRLAGQVRVSGGKNSALKLLAASILTDEKITLSNFPAGLLDIKTHLEMLKFLGKTYQGDDSKVVISEGSSTMRTELIWEERSIRNTLLIMGALTARFGNARVPLPGGCKLGDRKYDLHIMLLEKMGAKVWQEGDFLCAAAEHGLHGAEIVLPIRSTGATENAILSATVAAGNTTIWNPHIRPEVCDLVALLNRMGAKIKIRGQKCVEVEGVNYLHGTDHTVIADNMEALTWAIGSVITGGDVEIVNFPFEHLEVPLIYLRESGMKAYRGLDSLIVKGGVPYPVEISTGPYPGINSDMQPLFAVYGAMSRGVTKVVDLRFPGRYGYADELALMGLNSSVHGDMLTIDGGTPLNGATVRAIDLRAGIALMLAGLTAEGETEILDDWQITRGYECLDEKLAALGFAA